eukprot:TRINITY_DN4390_c0_g2_i5.p1 TRINITY_DN4390_c0_g2~~TRINITY_DN4390_c0_g2_i5.p1  ORF type:complete len:974 (-),score=264.71 TRINITY_DN4390_c0_g2_i5:107-3028(-)
MCIRDRLGRLNQSSRTATNELQTQRTFLEEERGKAQARIRELEKLLADSEEENGRLTQRLRAASSERDALGGVMDEQIKRLQTKTRSLEGELQDKQQENERLSQIAKRITAESDAAITQKEEENKKLALRTREIEVEAENLRGDVAKLKKQLAVKSEEVEREHLSLRSAEMNLRSELEALRNDYEVKLKAARAKQTELEEALSQLSRETEKARLQFEAARREYEQVRSDADRRVREATHRMGQLEANNSDLIQEIERLSQERLQMEEWNMEKKATENNYRVQLESLNREIERLRSENSAIARLNDETQRMLTQNTSSKDTRIMQLSTENTSLGLENGELKRRISDLEAKLNSTINIGQENNELKRKISELEALLNNSSNFSFENGELERRIQELEAKVNSSKLEIEGFNQEKQAWTTEMRTIRESLAKKERELESFRGRTMEFGQEKINYEDVIIKLRARTGELENELSLRMEEVENLVQRIDESEQAHHQKMEELENEFIEMSNTLKQRVAEQEAMLQKKDQELRILQNRARETEMSISRQREDVAREKSQERINYDGIVQRLRKRIGDLETDIARKDSELNVLGSRTSEVDRRYRIQLEELSAQIERERAEKREIIRDCDEKLTAMKSNNMRLDAVLLEKTRELDQMKLLTRQKDEDFRKEIEQLRLQMDRMVESEESALTGHFEALQASYGRIEEDNKNLREKLKEMIDEIHNLKFEIEYLKRTNAEYQKEVEMVQESKEKMEKEYTSEIQRINERLNETRLQSEDVNEYVAAFEEERADLNTKILQQRLKTVDLENKVMQLTTENQKLSEELRNIRAEGNISRAIPDTRRVDYLADEGLTKGRIAKVSSRSPIRERHQNVAPEVQRGDTSFSYEQTISSKRDLDPMVKQLEELKRELLRVKADNVTLRREIRDRDEKTDLNSQINTILNNREESRQSQNRNQYDVYSSRIRRAKEEEGTYAVGYNKYEQ